MLPRTKKVGKIAVTAGDGGANIQVYMDDTLALQALHLRTV
jgi:hypothetical protein